MKIFFKCILLMAILSMPTVCKAQSGDMVKNKALSAQYKSEITIASHEIKALKAKVKANPADGNVNVEVEKKKIVDSAIKAENASLKATKAAEKAKQKAEKAAQKAQKLHAPAQ